MHYPVARHRKMRCPCTIHQLFVQFTHKAKRHRKIILLHTFHSVVQCLNVVQDIIDIRRNIPTCPHLCLDGVDHRRHCSFNLTRRSSILAQIHEQEKILIWQKLRDTVQFTKQSRGFVVLLQELRIEYKPLLWRKLAWDKGLKAPRLCPQCAEFDGFHGLCWHLLLNVYKV